MKFIKPKRLEQGDTIAIVSPSSGAAHKFPHIYESGIKTLKNLGLDIKEYPTARASNDFLYKNPEKRAEDLNKAFEDKEADAIITTIGGDDSIRTLPFINTKVAVKNPKTIMGLSDTTTIITYYNQTGLVTFYGPSVMAGLSQASVLPKEFIA